MATASLSPAAKQVGRRIGTALSGEVRGVPVAIIVMLLAGLVAGGVVAVTTNFFEQTPQPVRSITPPRI